jgi:hypothetical protein
MKTCFWLWSCRHADKVKLFVSYKLQLSFLSMVSYYLFKCDMQALSCYKEFVTSSSMAYKSEVFMVTEHSAA